MSRFEIREAGLDQLDLLMQWRMEVLHEVFHDSYPDWNALEEENRRYYQKHLADHSHAAYFLMKEKTIVGCGGLCLYQEMPSPDNPSGWCGYLMNIYTRPAYRKQGGAEMIVQALIKKAEERHCQKIYLETSEMGRNLYRHSGFIPLKDYMILDPQ